MKIFNSANVARLMNIAISNTFGTTTTADGATDDGLICSEDLSNFVQCGMTVAQNLTIENFVNTVTNMLEYVGKIYYENMTADGTDMNLFGLMVDSNEFAVLREKVRIDHTNFEASFVLDENASSSFNDLFGKHPFNFNVKVWGNKGLYRTKPFTISYENFKTSVMSLDGYRRLIAEIWSVIDAVVIIAISESPMFCVRQQIANCAMIRPNVRIINLAHEYFVETGNNFVSADEPNFAKWFVKYQRHLKRLLKKPTVKFGGTSTFPINTPDMYRKSFLIDTFYDDINNGLSGVYHDDKIGNIDDYELLTYIENINEPNKLDIVPADAPTLTVGKKVTRVQIDNIVGMIWDRRGTFWSMEYRDVRENTNNFDAHSNYISTVGASHCVDGDSNAVVFVISDNNTTNGVTITEEEV